MLHSPLPFVAACEVTFFLGVFALLLYERGLPWCLWRFGGCLMAIGLSTRGVTACAVNSCDHVMWYELALKSVSRVRRFGSSSPGPSHLPRDLRFGSMRVPSPQGMVGADAVRGLFTWI